MQNRGRVIAMTAENVLASRSSLRRDEDATESDGSSRPECPRCGGPVVSVTVFGPTDAVAAPCGCRVAPGSLEDD